MVKKKKILIHIKDNSKISFDMANNVKNFLSKNNIDATIMVDKTIYNRQYPYITLNEGIICPRKLIRMKRRGMI